MLADGLAEIIIGGLVVGTFASWGVLSVAQYHPRLANWVIAHDHLMLVPQWSFFAPVPNQSDFYFYIRLQFPSSEELTSWEEVPLARPRGWYAFMWNPDRRIRKGFFDLTSEICCLVQGTRETILVSLPYLHLLTVATDLSERRGAARVQFAVGRTEPSGSKNDFIVLFASEVHEIERLEDRT